MKCIKCGNELKESDIFCPICGTPAKKENQVEENQNTYTYDRPENQQFNYGVQLNNSGQTNNYEQQYGKNKSKNDIIKICMISIIILTVVVCLFVIGRALIKGNNEKISSGDLLNDLSTSESDKSTSDNGTISSISSENTSKSNSYRVNLEGFKIYIPDNLIYDVDDSDHIIEIEDEESTWIAEFGIKEGSFQKLKQNKNYLRSYLMQEFSEITVTNVTEETIGGVEYLLLECTVSGTNMIVGYAEINSMYSVFFDIINENNDFDRSPINNLSSIINSAEYTGESTYIKLNENIKITGIDKAFDKAIKETSK